MHLSSFVFTSVWLHAVNKALTLHYALSIIIIYMYKLTSP